MLLPSLSVLGAAEAATGCSVRAQLIALVGMTLAASAGMAELRYVLLQIHALGIIHSHSDSIHALRHANAWKKSLALNDAQWSRSSSRRHHRARPPRFARRLRLVNWRPHRTLLLRHRTRTPGCDAEAYAR